MARQPTAELFGRSQSSNRIVYLGIERLRHTPIDTLKGSVPRHCEAEYDKPMSGDSVKTVSR
jgi:hypothetical protein